MIYIDYLIIIAKWIQSIQYKLSMISRNIFFMSIREVLSGLIILYTIFLLNIRLKLDTIKLSRIQAPRSILFSKLLIKMGTYFLERQYNKKIIT